MHIVALNQEYDNPVQKEGLTYYEAHRTLCLRHAPDLEVPMFRAIACAFAIASAVVLAPTVARADTQVFVNPRITVPEIRSYVEDVDRRLQKGRYDVIGEQERAWMIDSIAALRDSLQTADQAAPPSPELILQAGEFETGMIKIEEGGIVCRSEARVGTHRKTTRCYSLKQLEEEQARSRESLRALRRPQKLPSLEPVG